MTDNNVAALRIEGMRLRDCNNREVILRGVNLGGDCKLPFPNGGTHIPTDFSDHKTVSFIGRPFPLEDADAHFERLKYWGFNCLRLLTTWEAVEHEGPGLYDKDYLDYLAEITRRAGEFGFFVFIDFHQDAWSRMSGGSGAPGWTFDVVGLDFTQFQQADAAIVMQSAMDWSNQNPHQDAYPQMVWSSNYQLPANGVMWTLFWLGRSAVPDFNIEGRNIQDYLQEHYLGAVEQAAMRLKNMPHVIGFDTLNEPGTGWANLPLSQRISDPHALTPAPLKPGPIWTPLDCLAAARGAAVKLPVLTRDADGSLTVSHEQIFNADRISIWKDGGECPFEAAGIYALENGEARPLKEDAFQCVDGRPLSISDDCYRPFFQKFADGIRTHRQDWIVFAEMDPFALIRGRRFPTNMPPRWVNASHWYDVAILYAKTLAPHASHDILTGEPDVDIEGLRARYLRQLRLFKEQSRAAGAPALVGEFGIPFDLDHGAAYRAWREGRRDNAIWRDHECALTLMYDALDTLLIHSTQWNYAASNRNDAWIGDGWNQEDLSIWSGDQVDDPTDPDSGGRAIDGFCRPFVSAAQGTIRRMHFNACTLTFSAVIAVDPSISAPTEIYLPNRRYPDGALIETSCTARVEYHQIAQRGLIYASEQREMTIIVTRA